MSESISTRLNASGIGGMSKSELRFALLGLLDAVNAMAKKLDADAGVADTNYAATVADLIKE